MDIDFKKYKGLSTQEAEKKIQEFGLNKIQNTLYKSNLEVLLHQFRSPLIIFLVIVGIGSIIFREYADAFVIFLVIFVNAFVGFLQETRSQKATDSLKKLVAQKNSVWRDGEIIQIEAERIVPGDLVIVARGERITADGLILNGRNIELNESQITGESFPVEKKEGDKVFMGSFLVGGSIIFEVQNTGMSTSLGKIAGELSKKSSDSTPLERKIKTLTKFIISICFVLILSTFILGVINGYDFNELTKSLVSLAISIIPEGLPIVVTITLAIGVFKMSQSRAIMKNLASVSTLASTDIICTDKTGTLTEGRITLEKLIQVENEYDINTLIVLCNDAIPAKDGYIGDLLDISILEYSKLTQEEVINLRYRYQRRDEISFDSEKKYQATLNKFEDNNLIIVKGALDKLIEKSSLDLKDRNKIVDNLKNLTSSGYRVLGLFVKRVEINKETLSQEDLKDLDLVAILCFSDPVRSDVAHSIKYVQEGGINVVVITGDYENNALAVSRQVNLHVSSSQSISGKELGSLQNLFDPEKYKLVYRANPQDKLRIIKDLQLQGYTVAMTGDGINDGPALVKADIGISMGKDGTDVARESSDMVLSDDSFTTIVKGVEEARGVFENLRKVVSYLFLTSFGEFFVFFVLILLDKPIPLLASQILWLNLVTDGFFDVTLATERKEGNLMKFRPNRYRNGIVTKFMVLQILFFGLFMGFLGIFFYNYISVNNTIEYVRSSLLVILALVQFGIVLNVRSNHQSIFSIGLFSNKFINFAFVIQIVLLVLAIYFPFFQNILKTVPVSLDIWMYGLLSIFIVIFFDEVRKFISKKMLRII